MNLRKVFYESYQFVMQRRKQEGGFAATPLLPASVEDTYYALKIIEDLKEFGLNIDYEPYKDEELKLWIQRNKNWKEPKVFYQFLKVCRLCNIEIGEEVVKQSFDSLFLRVITLERAFYLTKISELINSPLLPIKKLSVPQLAKDLWMLIYPVDKGIIHERFERQ